MPVTIKQHITDEQRKNIAQFLASTKPPEENISTQEIHNILIALCKTCIENFATLVCYADKTIILQTNSIPIDLLKALYYRIPAGYSLEIENYKGEAAK
jgi:hypothetical protein